VFHFSKETVKVMNLFVRHRALRIAYYVGAGAVYLFAVAAVIKAVRWW